MRALVFSDSHRQINCMADIIDREENIDLIIFAGDVEEDAEELRRLYPQKSIVSVKGNNDFLLKGVPDERLFTFGNKKIFLTHGHKYGVKYSPYKLFAAAREKGADICIFGHTHSKFLEEESGIFLLNPGAAYRSAALIDVSDNDTEILFLY